MVCFIDYKVNNTTESLLSNPNQTLTPQLYTSFLLMNDVYQSVNLCSAKRIEDTVSISQVRHKKSWREIQVEVVRWRRAGGRYRWR